MKELRLAGKTIKILTKDRMHYPAQMAADTMALIARCGVLIVLYWYVFRLKGGTINGATFPVVAWSMFFYFALLTLQLRNVARRIMDDVQTGKIETLLNKPMSYLGYKISWQIGSGLFSFLVAFVFGAILLFAFVGLPPVMTAAGFLPTFLLILAGSVALTLAVYMLVGLLSFWVEDINPVFWVVDKGVMILGGSYLPIALFPSLMYKIAVYSPFGASQFVSHASAAAWFSEWPLLVGVQMAWIVFLVAVILIVFNLARKKVSVNGG